MVSSAGHRAQFYDDVAFLADRIAARHMFPTPAHALVLLPLVAKQATFGVLSLAFDSAQHLHPSDRTFLSMLARQCAGALEIARAAHPASGLIEKARDLFSPIASERGLVFETSIAEAMPTVHCDPQRALQVFASLVTNALKVTPRGGRIAIGAAPQAETIVFFVRDSGPGIDEDELPTVFERSWRSKHQSYRGAGLGLAIARGIVDAHGGRIWAESQAGAGSTFYFSFDAPRGN